jgi:tape measure domain-containing protein
MAGPISQYWASVGIRTDEKDLKKVDDYLRKIEARLSKSTGKKGLQVNLFVDEAKFHKHLQGVMNRVGKSSPLKLANVTIDPAAFSKSVRETLAKAQFKAPISAIVTRASLQNVRAQVAAALQGLPINIRVGNVSSRGVSNRGGDGSESARRRASLTGRGDPSLQEFLMGRPDKSSLSAGNRRYLDAIVGKATGGVGASPLSRMAIQGGVGGLARLGGGSVLGRAAGMAGLAFGGPVGGTLGLGAGGIMSMAGTAFTGIWSTLGKVITLPFQAISTAASAVTGAFYRIATAAIPLVFGFNMVNKNVQQVKSREIALNTTAGRFGSNAATESSWLMSMANREGMAYSTMIDPYTSFMAAAAPALGVSRTRGIFEAFNQYGSTHGANKESSGRAMYALSQIASKGTVMSEELNQQMAEAVGYSGMKQLFAEAYQMSLGRTGNALLKGEKAITELADAMKKGAVKSAKVLPYLEELMRRDSAPGLSQARTSSIAEQNRFRNQVDQGWKNFSSGGGEQGVAFFWQMMQKMGTWWVDNGATLGGYFESAVRWLDTFRLGVYEFFQFTKTGETNSFVEWVSGFGINLEAFRVEFVKMFENISRIFGGVGEETDLKTRIQNFGLRLQEILAEVNVVLAGIARFIEATRGLSEKKWYESYALLNPFSDLSKRSREAAGGIMQAVGGVTGATTSAAGVFTDQVGVTSPTRTDYSLFGNGKGGYNNKTWIPTAPSELATRPSDVNPEIPRVSKLDVRLDVQGNQELIAALMDERAKAAFPVLLSSEIAKQVVNAPISGSR